MRNKAKSRTCCGCREVIDKGSLLRIVKTSDGEVLVDKEHKADGRGAYIHKNEKCFKAALKSKAIERSLKTAIPSMIYDEVEKEIADVSE